MSEEGEYHEKEEEVEQMEGDGSPRGCAGQRGRRGTCSLSVSEPAVWALGEDGQAEGKAGAKAIGAKCAHVPAAVTAWC